MTITNEFFEKGLTYEMLPIWEKNRITKKANNYLDILIKKYGVDSEPVLFFKKTAWNYQNMEHYFKIAASWIFRD